MVKRAYLLDWKNMSKQDWEEVGRTGDRLTSLNECYGLPFPQDPDHAKCKAFYKDLLEHNDFWMQEIFHPLECDKGPYSHCERALLSLIGGMLRYYWRREQLEKALDVLEVSDRVFECFRKQVFEQTVINTTGKRKAFPARAYQYHAMRYNITSLVDERRETCLESFRTCCEIEMTHPNAIGGRTDMVQLLTETGIVRTTPTVKILKKRVTDDQIYAAIVHARKMREIFHRSKVLLDRFCPLCSSSENLMQCGGCRQVSFCCRQHQVEFWPKHKKACRAAQAKAIEAANDVD